MPKNNLDEQKLEEFLDSVELVLSDEEDLSTKMRDIYAMHGLSLLHIRYALDKRMIFSTSRTEIEKKEKKEYNAEFRKLKESSGEDYELANLVLRIKLSNKFSSLYGEQIMSNMNLKEGEILDHRKKLIGRFEVGRLSSVPTNY